MSAEAYSPADTSGRGSPERIQETQGQRTYWHNITSNLGLLFPFRFRLNTNMPVIFDKVHECLERQKKSYTSAQT